MCEKDNPATLQVHCVPVSFSIFFAKEASRVLRPGHGVEQHCHEKAEEAQHCSQDAPCFPEKVTAASASCRYAGGADAAALSELRDACAGALRYAQEHNAYADEAEGQAALVIAWQCAVEVTFSRRCVPDAPDLAQLAAAYSFESALHISNHQQTLLRLGRGDIDTQLECHGLRGQKYVSSTLFCLQI